MASARTAPTLRPAALPLLLLGALLAAPTLSAQAYGAPAAGGDEGPDVGYDVGGDARFGRIVEGGLDVEHLRARWLGAMETFRVPGASVAVVKDGEVLALLGLGARDEHGRPVDADTGFYIASCTKTYVAAAVAALADAGRLDLDAPVRKAWKEFEVSGHLATRRTTLRELLTHQAGLDSGPIVFLDAYSGEITEERYARWLARVEPLGRPEYTNLHYTILGRVIEAVTGEDWRDHLRDALFAPLGMDRTTAYASVLYGDENVAVPMADDGAGGFVASRVRKTDRVMHAAGGMGTTARDAARWLLACMPGGALEAEGLLTPQTRADMVALHTDLGPRGSIRRLQGFGLAWRVGTFRGRPYAVHGGGYVGTAAHMSFLPEHGIGVAVLANAAGGGHLLADIVSIDVYDALLGETDSRDLLPPYEERAKSFPFSTEAPPAPLPVTALARPPEAYVGRFEHADWGAVDVALEDDVVSIRMGDLVFDAEPRDPDRFRLTAGGGQIWFEAEFPAGSSKGEDGGADAVPVLRLWDDELDLEFRRVR